MLAASLGEIAPRRNSELGGKRLKKNSHEARNHHSAEQRIAVPRAAAQVRRPVARIHVAHGCEVAGPGIRNHFAKKGSTRENRTAAIGFRKRWRTCSRLKISLRNGSCFFRIAGA